MKIITMLACIIFSILITACASSGEIEKANALIGTLQSQLSQKDSDLQKISGELKMSQNEAKANTTELSKRISELEVQLKTAQDQLKTSTEDRDKLSQKLKDTEKDLSAVRSDAASLHLKLDKLVCDEQISSMKYQDVLDASRIVSAWWAQQSDVKKVTRTYRDKIWSNALTGIHGVNYISESDGKEYVEHFLVYFHEFDMKPAVFYIKGQCWLDSP